MQRMWAELLGKGEQFAGVSRPTCPINDGLVMRELGNLSEPLCPAFTRNRDYVAEITLPQTATDTELSFTRAPQQTTAT